MVTEPAKPYVHQPFPSARYHAKHGMRLVNNPDEEALLGEGWYHSPADIPEDEKEAVEEGDVDALAAENEDLRRQLAAALAAKGEPKPPKPPKPEKDKDEKK